MSPEMAKKRLRSEYQQAAIVLAWAIKQSGPLEMVEFPWTHHTRQSTTCQKDLKPIEMHIRTEWLLQYTPQVPTGLDVSCRE
mmetsp:Transcript_30349/g.93952  ORF Transcript_30349/g.93952 Transcript_30349/m.93952 type:complete len:82 (+) Transcript_30349:187-432(+)